MGFARFTFDRVFVPEIIGRATRDAPGKTRARFAFTTCPWRLERCAQEQLGAHSGTPPQRISIRDVGHSGFTLCYDSPLREAPWPNRDSKTSGRSNVWRLAVSEHSTAFSLRWTI